jgi:hypothetical protein
MSAAATFAQAPLKAQRHSRGKRPRFYPTQGLDDAMAMVVVLAQELCVLRDRVDAIERVSKARGIDLAAEVDALQFDQAALDARESRRQELFERLFYLVRKQAHELTQAETEQSYRSVIDETAKA